MTRRPTILALILALAALPATARKPSHGGVRSMRPQHGVASFYGRKEAGRKTASGERMSPARMTAASNTLPLGTKARVVNKETGKAAQVTINDRGPHKPGRVIDVTPKAAEALGIDRKDGLAEVVVQPVSLPPPDPK